jgi:hypothetical protein
VDERVRVQRAVALLGARWSCDVTAAEVKPFACRHCDGPVCRDCGQHPLRFTSMVGGRCENCAAFASGTFAACGSCGGAEVKNRMGRVVCACSGTEASCDADPYDPEEEQEGKEERGDDR